MIRRAKRSDRALNVRRGRCSGRPGRLPTQPRSRPAVILLEVVLSVTLFFCASLVIMAGLNAALRTAQRVQLEAQAADLAVTLLSEVQMGLLAPTNDGPNAYEEEELVDWTWEIASEAFEEEILEVDLPEFLQVEIIIRHGPTGYVYRLTELMAEELLSRPPESPEGDEFAPGPGERF